MQDTSPAAATFLFCLGGNFFHFNTVMAFFVNAFHVPDQKYLGGLVIYGEYFRDLIGDGPVS